MGLEFRIRSGLRNLLNKPRAEAELDDELRAYVEMVTDEKVAAGLSPAEARRSTLAEFGGVEQVKQAVREERAGAGLELLGQDFSYGLRQLRKSPAFSLAAVLTLALGIGTTAAMFSVVDAVVLRPLPYSNVDRIVDVKTHSASTFWQVCSWPGYLEMRRENATFQDLAGYAPYWGMTLRVGDQAQYVRVTQGTDNFFHVFGVNPMLGRTFLPGEDTSEQNNIVVLSYEIWRRAFNGNRNVVGTAVHLDGESYQVIGVMPPGFRFPLGEPNVVYIPMHVRPNWLAGWRDHWLLTVGLVKPGVNLQTAEADMSRVMANIGNQKPDSDRGRTVQLMPITAALHGENELPEILVMLGAVLAVLLTACVNIAGLLMVRGLGREREMALRIAIGAAKFRIVRQLLVENILLGALGGATGLLFAMGLLAAMKVFLAQAFMHGGNVQLNLPVVLSALGISVLSSIGAGLVPALRASKSDPNRALKSGVSAACRSQNRLRAGFVITTNCAFFGAGCVFRLAAADTAAHVAGRSWTQPQKPADAGHQHSQRRLRRPRLCSDTDDSAGKTGDGYSRSRRGGNRRSASRSRIWFGDDHATGWPPSRSAGSREKLGKQNPDARILCSDWRAHCAGPPFFIAGHSFVAADRDCE